MTAPTTVRSTIYTQYGVYEGDKGYNLPDTVKSVGADRQVNINLRADRWNDENEGCNVDMMYSISTVMAVCTCWPRW